MGLSRYERERLAMAIRAAYGFEDLAQFLDYRLDMDIEDLCSRDTSKREAVRLLLIRASQQGWFDRLVGALREDTSNPDLIEVLDDLFNSPSTWRATSVSLVPPLESGVVDRVREAETLARLVLDASRARPSPLVAIHGPGGFGKTTLAIQACHDPRLAAEFDMFLWVETGQHCTPARVVQLIGDLCVHLGEDRPALTEPDQAGLHLAQVLRDRRVLLVVDNVWSAGDLSPFLLGGPGCLRLVTTCNARVCPANAEVLHLGGMTAPEISELLRRSLRGTGDLDPQEVAELCGGWPLLASVLGASLDQELAAGASAHDLLDETRRELLISGPGAFDIQDSSRRISAIGQVMRSSLQSLEEHVRIGDGERLRERYLDLGIFPASTPIPVDVLAVWWGHEHGWTPRAVSQFSRVLTDRSLVDSYQADRKVLILHDVFRACLRGALGELWPDRHRSLILAFAALLDDDWTQLPARYEYMWRNLPYHMAQAEMGDKLARLLSDPHYVIGKVALLGYQSLAVDQAALLSLESFPAVGDELYHQFQAAKALTGSGHLLHGLEVRSDVAATLLARLVYLGVDGLAVDELRSMVRVVPCGFDPQWVRTPAAVAEGSEPPGHVGAVTDVSCGQAVLASCGEDGTVRTWDIQSRRLSQVFYGHTGWVFAVELSPDEELIASAGEDAVIRLRQRASGQLIGILDGHTRRIRSLVFDSAGRRLISGGEDGRVCVWDVSQLRLLLTLKTPGTPVWSVAVSPDDQMVAIGGEDEFVRLYDLESGALLDEKAAHRDWVRSVSFAREAHNPILVSGSGDCTVCVWSAGGGRLAPLRTIETGRSRPRSVRLLASSRVLAADEDAVIHLWNQVGPVSSQAMPATVDWIRAIEVSKDGASVLAGCEDGGVRLWSHLDGQLADIGRGANAVWSAAFSDRGQLALAGCGDGSLEVRETASGDLLGTLSAGQGRVWSLASAEDTVAAACGDGAVRVWDVAQGAQTTTITPPETRTWSVALDPAGRHLAASMMRGILRVWDLSSGQPVLEELHAHAGRIRSMAFSPSGESLVTGSGDGLVRVWDVASGHVREEFANPGGWVRAVAVDRAIIAVGSGGGCIHVWDRHEGRVIAQLAGHSGRVLMLAFGGETGELVSAAADGTVRVWSLRDGCQLSEIRCDSSLLCAAFDPYRRVVLASGALEMFAIRIGSIEASR